jgi:hypothetical protein
MRFGVPELLVNIAHFPELIDRSNPRLKHRHALVVGGEDGDLRGRERLRATRSAGLKVVLATRWPAET